MNLPAARSTHGIANTAQSRGRICVLFHDLRGGGAERVMLALVRGFVEAGRAVDVVMVSKRGEYLAAVPHEARIVDLGASHVLNAIPALVRYLRKERPFVVLSGLTHVNIAAAIALRLARTGATLVLTEHNQISIKARRAKGLRSRLTYRGVRHLYPTADAIIGVSEGVSRDLARFAHLSDDRVRTIYNPVTHPGIARAAAEPPEHPWFGSDRMPVILGVGRLHPQKGFDVLLRAFAQVRQQEECRLVIAGEGEERPALEALASELGIAEHVSLPGFVANPFALMARAAVFALSSRFEGMPTVLVEAMYCGAPVVATNCPSGPSETLDGGRYGALVPVDDPAALARAILTVLRERPRPSVERAQQYSVAASVEAYLKVLECR